MNLDSLEALESVVPGDVDNTFMKKRAMKLHCTILDDCEHVVQSLRDICVNLSYIKDDNLYTLLGFTTFRLYVEIALNFTYSQAQKYYSVGLFIRELESREEQSNADTESIDLKNFADLGIEKMYILASCTDSERMELSRTKDLVSISKRDLKKNLKNLRSTEQNREDVGFRGSVGEFKEAMKKAAKEYDQQLDQDDLLQIEDQSAADASPPMSEEKMSLIQMLKQINSLIFALEMFYRNEDNEKDFGDLEFRHYLRRFSSAVNRDLNDLE